MGIMPHEPACSPSSCTAATSAAPRPSLRAVFATDILLAPFLPQRNQAKQTDRLGAYHRYISLRVNELSPLELHFSSSRDIRVGYKKIKRLPSKHRRQFRSLAMVLRSGQASSKPVNPCYEIWCPTYGCMRVSNAPIWQEDQERQLDR